MSNVASTASERPASFGRLLLWLVRATATSLLVVVALGIALGSSSRAVEPEEVAGTGNDSSWLPSASLFGAILRGQAEGDVLSSLRQPAGGNELFVAPGVGLGTEILTPALAVGPVELRAVAHADFSAYFGFEREIAKEGNPGALTIPTLPSGNRPPIGEVGGRGSVTKAETGPWLFLSGAGLSLGFDLWDRHFRIKPTLEYRRDEVKVTGFLSDVTTEAPPPDFREIQISSSGSQVFHSLGPGLEIEVDTGRVGDLAVSIFLTGRGWKLLGDRQVALRASCCSDTGPTESAFFRYERDPWSFGSTVGIRLRWSPEQ